MEKICPAVSAACASFFLSMRVFSASKGPRSLGQVSTVMRFIEGEYQGVKSFLQRKTPPVKAGF
jgi:hypothetical protein